MQKVQAGAKRKEERPLEGEQLKSRQLSCESPL